MSNIQSNVSFKLQSNINEQSASVMNTANVSNVSPSAGEGFPATKYETKKEKFFRKAHAAVNKGKEA